MLGEKIYNLRRSKRLSQEDFSEILNTSRQAVSKWERNEAKPDIDKLIIIAKLFNVSIDYLLSYEIKYSDVNGFIDELKNCYKNNKLIIDINDIKSWCSKYPNNFKLHVYSAEYLFVAFVDNNNAEYLDLALSYINKAIILFIPEYSDIASLNELHCSVAEIYLMQEKYDLAKEYVEKNNVFGSEVLLAKCDFYLNNYDDALKRSSEIYLKSTSDIMNVMFVQINVLLMKKKIKEAYDLDKWIISFINSILIDNDFFKCVLCPFVYLKSTCERLLKISDEESIKILKEMSRDEFNHNVLSETNSLKYYFGKTDTLLLIDSNVQNSLKEIINHTSKEEFHYQTLIDIYDEIFGGSVDE